MGIVEPNRMNKKFRPWSRVILKISIDILRDNAAAYRSLNDLGENKNRHAVVPYFCDSLFTLSLHLISPHFPTY
jgi:hypothetical protein